MFDYFCLSPDIHPEATREQTGAMDQVNFSAWENRTETRNGGLSAQLAEMARATFGHSRAGVQPGDEMPLLWHWFAFLPTTDTADLKGDGHPPLGDFLPPVRLERRMWASGSLQFHRPLHIEERLTRVSTIRSVAEKTGAAGEMVFVTVDHEISGEDGLAISEQQDVVYLPIPDAYTPPRKKPAPDAPDFRSDLTLSEPLLFRYSALTFNAHRIHYDLPYAQQVEHYPGLVVHGPLQATFLIEAAARRHARAPDAFSFRGVHPVFVKDRVHIAGVVEDGSRVSLCTAVTETDTTYQGMHAQATWEETS